MELNEISASKDIPESTSADPFTFLVDALNSPVSYLTTNHSYQYINQAYLTWAGCTRDEVIGKTIAEFRGQAVFDQVSPYLQKVLNGEKVTLEQYVPYQDGEKYIQAKFTPDIRSDGNLAGYLVEVVDITNFKVEEKKWLHLAAIVESSSDAIISKTLDGTITSWNDAAVRMFGYSAAEMIGQSITRLIPPHRMNEEPAILDQLKKGLKVEPFETQRITRTGHILDISLAISPVRDIQGTIIGASKIARNITRQKQIENSIRENEERFRMAVELTNLGTWEYNLASKEVILSAECRKIYGVTAEMTTDYMFFKTLTHEDDRAYVKLCIKRAMDPHHNGSINIQYRIQRHYDQQIRWVSGQGKVYFNANRVPERFIGTILDITEEKEQEQRLKDSIELFTTMADNVPAMIWMSGDDKFRDYFNKTWLKFTGRTSEQESNEGWLENVHEEDVEKCVSAYTDAFKHQKPFYTEYRLKRYDGQYRWVADNSVPRYHRNGDFAGFISACIDIDDQKLFREKILSSELLLNTISNAAPVGLWMTDTHAMNTFVNQTWVEWTGVPVEKQNGNGWLERVVEEDKIKAPASFRNAMEKREKYSTEFRIQRPDGEIQWCFTEGSPYYDLNQNFAGYAGSVTDITEFKRLEQRKDDFIKMASHELKTPITSIKGYVQLLMKMYEELNEEQLFNYKDKVKSSLTTISKQVSKLTRLISELLDLSKIESGKLELQKTNFDLATLIEETVHEVRQTASRHSIEVNVHYTGQIYADRDRLGQVIVNLLTNAIKYSPEAEMVSIQVEKQNRNFIVKVKDQGIGIDKKDHLRIFERFYRVEGLTEQTYPGFGIGLFIACEIVQRHDGAIEVESEKGKGSTFTITIPDVTSPV